MKDATVSLPLEILTLTLTSPLRNDQCAHHCAPLASDLIEHPRSGEHVHYGDSQQYVHIISIGSTGPCISEGFPWAVKNSCDDGPIFD